MLLLLLLHYFIILVDYIISQTFTMLELIRKLPYPFSTIDYYCYTLHYVDQN